MRSSASSRLQPEQVQRIRLTILVLLLFAVLAVSASVLYRLTNGELNNESIGALVEQTKAAIRASGNN